MSDPSQRQTVAILCASCTRPVADHTTVEAAFCLDQQTRHADATIPTWTYRQDLPWEESARAAERWRREWDRKQDWSALDVPTVVRRPPPVEMGETARAIHQVLRAGMRADGNGYSVEAGELERLCAAAAVVVEAVINGRAK